MDIVITASSYYPAKNGIQNVTQYQAEGLVKLGHQVKVITSNEGGTVASEELINGVQVYRVDAYNKNMFHFGDKEGFQKLVLEHAKTADALLSICFESFSADWLYPIIDKIKCKKIMMVHGMHDFQFKKGMTLKKIIQLIKWNFSCKVSWKSLMKFDCAIHLHEKDDSVLYFRKNGFSNNEVIYNAVDSSFFENSQKENIIINVSTYHSNKNQVRCLETFWNTKLENWKLVLIGTPDNEYYRSLLELKNKLTKEKGHRDVAILCNVSRDETIDYIKKAKIYFLSSNSEHFPISVIEAMATGAAYLSTDVGIMKYLPGGIVSQIEKLTENLEELSGNWREYGAIAERYAYDNFQQAAQVKKLEEIIIKNL